MNHVNELDPRLLGIAATNPFIMHDSSSRIQMFCTHLGQALVMKNPTVRRTLTGVEREYARYTHSIRMPCNAIILKCIHKYPKTIGFDNVATNPLITVIYENADSPQREIGILDLTTFHCTHQYFGFKYAYRPIVNRLTPGTHIPKGTIIADSPSVTEEGDYKYGIELQMALMSMPGAIEDGIIVRRGVLDKMTTKGFSSRIESWGKNRFPLNLYGDAQNYKPFPDIGDNIRPDGLLFAVRQQDDLLAPVTLSPSALTEPDIFDRSTYAIPNAKVVDVIIHKGLNNRVNLPSGMDTQTQYYHNKSLSYYETLINEYNYLKRIHREGLRISPQFQRLLVESMAMTRYNDKAGKVSLMYNRNPIDEWMVEVVFEYDIVPTIGFKVTCTNGGKGIICEIMEDDHMPVDDMGNRADIIMADVSTINRMNLGRVYEQYINAAGLKLSKQIAAELQTCDWKPQPDHLDVLWDRLIGFYRIVSPRMYEMLIASGGESRKLEHIKDVARDGIYLYVPTNNPAEYTDVINQLRKHYPAQYGPVTMKTRDGTPVRTVKPVLIGGMYMLLLEKIGNTWAACASGKLQYLGIPAKVTNADKYTLPYRPQPVKLFGESEVRQGVSMTPPDTMAEILDQANNPTSHRAIVDMILKSPMPTNIDLVISRDANRRDLNVPYVPRGNGRVVTYVKHVLECGGMRFVKGEPIP